VKTADNIDQ